jgi:hypothetical protein
MNERSVSIGMRTLFPIFIARISFSAINLSSVRIETPIIAAASGLSATNFSSGAGAIEIAKLCSVFMFRSTFRSFLIPRFVLSSFKAAAQNGSARVDAGNATAFYQPRRTTKGVSLGQRGGVRHAAAMKRLRCSKWFPRPVNARKRVTATASHQKDKRKTKNAGRLLTGCGNHLERGSVLLD